MDYATSCKVSNNDQAVKRQLVAGTVFLWVFKRQGRFSKCEASVNLRVTLEQYYSVNLRVTLEQSYCVSLRVTLEQSYCVNLRVTLEQSYCVNLRVTLEQSYLTFEAQELCTATWQAQKHTLPVDKSPSILPLVYSLVLSDSVFWCSLNCLAFFGHHYWVCDVTCEVIWLECQHCGTWNKNGIGWWPD